MKLSILTQIKRLLPSVIPLYTFVMALLLFVIAINYKTDIDIGIFTRDPAAIAASNGFAGSSVELEANPFVGIVSNVGILCWCICASVCFFSGAILKNNINTIPSQYKIIAGFFHCFAIISLILLLDDLFLFHEIIAPKLFYISEKTIYVCYATLILWGVIKYRKIILATNWYLFFLAFLFLGCSLLMDKFLVYIDPLQLFQPGLQLLLEDGFKLFGIVSWLGYFTQVCFQVIKDVVEVKTNYSINQQKIGHVPFIS